MRRLALVLVLTGLVGVAAGCSDDDGDASGSSTTLASSTTVEATTTTTTAPDPARYRETLSALADDAMEGRDNGTPGSTMAQDLLIAELREFADPLGDDFRQVFDEGTNVVGVIPGSELPDEYLVIGAHYDHLGRDCPTEVPGDDICNGATDNAAGVASVLEIGRRLAEGEPPRRSVVIAFWDAEEDGLRGAAAYVREPLVPLASTVAYLNWDIQGVDLLPSLATTTIVVGAETGGPALAEATARATDASELDYVDLSLLFGEGRSDHAVFAGAGVPSVFFTDANEGCYHTSQDDLSRVGFDKLDLQLATGEDLARDLVATDEVPEFDAEAPVASFDDAESMLAVVERAEPDFATFGAEDQATVNTFLGELRTIVAAGEAAFDDQAVQTLLGGSAALVSILRGGPCAAP